MTNRDIYCIILSEASGKPRSEVEALVEAMTGIAGRGNLDVELPDAKAQTLLADLRKELPGIRLWLEQGASMARKDWGLP